MIERGNRGLADLLRQGGLHAAAHIVRMGDRSPDAVAAVLEDIAKHRKGATAAAVAELVRGWAGETAAFDRADAIVK